MTNILIKDVWGNERLISLKYIVSVLLNCTERIDQVDYPAVVITTIAPSGSEFYSSDALSFTVTGPQAEKLRIFFCDQVFVPFISFLDHPTASDVHVKPEKKADPTADPSGCDELPF